MKGKNWEIGHGCMEGRKNNNEGQFWFAAFKILFGIKSRTT
jgi:hypothetical protein